MRYLKHRETGARYPILQETPTTLRLQGLRAAFDEPNDPAEIDRLGYDFCDDTQKPKDEGQS